MNALKSMIELVDDSKIDALSCSDKSLLKDLSGNHEASTYYANLLEATCDDLLEVVDKKIDHIAKFKATVDGDETIKKESLEISKSRSGPWTENTMRKP
jgi:hypothetical protein